MKYDNKESPEKILEKIFLYSAIGPIRPLVFNEDIAKKLYEQRKEFKKNYDKIKNKIGNEKNSSSAAAIFFFSGDYSFCRMSKIYEKRTENDAEK